MSFLALAKRRYSVRKYQEKMVEEEKLQQILEAGRVAPSAANNQSWRLIVVKEKLGLEKLRKTAKIYNAPLYIIVCGDHHTAWVRPYDKKDAVDIDASIVTDHMMLKATDLGLGTLWICYFDLRLFGENLTSRTTLNLLIFWQSGTPTEKANHRTVIMKHVSR
jgi:nitroreductase